MAAYRSSQPDLSYTSRSGPGPQRWDAERFVNERDVRAGEMTRYEERDYSYNDSLPIRSRRQSVAMEREVEREREREYYRSPSPPPLRRPMRPGMGLRRQSSLDTFDRRPTAPRYIERDELVRRPRRGYVEKEYERIEVDGPERAYYQEPFPERVREREIVRTRRRSRSSSSSSSSSASSVSSRSTRKNFPKRGRTRMPAKLVSKRAIIELGYPFEEEGQIIIIQKALGREHIDEVIQLSEKYKAVESKESKSSDRVVEEKRTETYYESNTTQQQQPMPVVPAQPVMAPLPPPPVQPAQPIYAQSIPHPQVVPVGPGQPIPIGTELVERKHTIIDHHGNHDHVHTHNDALIRRSRSMGPTPRHMELYGAQPYASQPYLPGQVQQHPYGNEVMVIGAGPHINHQHDAFTSSPGMIRRDIRGMAAEAEALRAEKRAARELRRADRIRYAGDSRAADGGLVLYDGGRGGRGDEVVEVRRSRKGPDPRAVRMMLKTLT